MGVETVFNQIKHISCLGYINSKSIKMIKKNIAILNFVYSFTSYIINLITHNIKTINVANKYKTQINKKIGIKTICFKFLNILLKKK